MELDEQPSKRGDRYLIMLRYFSEHLGFRYRHGDIGLIDDGEV